MSSENITLLISAVLTIIGVVWTTYGVPFIKAKVNAEELALLNTYVNTIVRCLQQVYTPDEWAKKKEVAMAKVRDYINTELHINMSDGDISDLIESMVYDLKVEFKALTE